jgi:hypothetical protein
MTNDYTQIDQELHQLVQTIAKANRTFVSPKEDDSHTNLFFDPVSCRIYGQWMDVGKEKVILTLNLVTSQFEWLNDTWNVLQSFLIEGKTQTQIEIEINEKLSELGLNTPSFLKEMHYQIPEYSFADQVWNTFSMERVKKWVRFRSLANQASGLVAGTLQTSSEIRIWPHHFDTGIYAAPNPNTGIGFGLAMQDSMVGAPYFYCSGYNLNGNNMVYSEMPDLTFGHWVVGGTWNGAVLSLLDLSDNEILKIRGFIEETVGWYLKK